MSASRTYIPDLPPRYVAAWRQAYLDRCRAASPLLGASGGVLDPLAPSPRVDQRVLRFGHVWHWWGLPPELKSYWEELG